MPRDVGAAMCILVDVPLVSKRIVPATRSMERVSQEGTASRGIDLGQPGPRGRGL